MSPTTWNTFVNTGYNTWNIYATTSQHNGTVGTYTRNTYSWSSGYYNLTTTNAIFLSLQETGTGNANYNNNSAIVLANSNGTQGSNADAGSVIYITLQLNDNDANTFGYNVTGTTTAQINVVYPETTYLANTWGTVTIASVSNTQV